MLVISHARIPCCWSNTRPPFMSPSLGSDLGMRPDVEVGQFLHPGLPFMDTKRMPPNGALVGALELLQIRHWNDLMREGKPEHCEEQLRPLKNGIRVNSQAGSSLAEATTCFQKGHPRHFQFRISTTKVRIILNILHEGIYFHILAGQSIGFELLNKIFLE